MKIKVFFGELLNLFYPNLCMVCSENLVRGEQHLCLRCIGALPRTDFHHQRDNAVEKRFWGKVDVFRASSFFYFHKGSPFQKLIHALKYRGNRELGETLGKYAAADLLEDADFCSVDVVIPVPLHPNKERKRGYNQSEYIARGVAAIFNKPLSTDNLFRAIENPTQTKKTVYERFLNTEGIFALKNPGAFENRHVLIVDDVLTTGSTLEACACAFKNVKGVKVSLFTLAVA